MTTKKLKRTTYTTLVMEALVRADDFRTMRQLVNELGITGCRVSAALHSLHQYSAIDVVEGSDALWWFATPDEDTRIRTVSEIVDESIKRKRRKSIPHPRRKVLDKPTRR